MANVNWEADKMLDVYIHDYMIKRNLHYTAKTFMAEAKVSTDPVAIDAPGSFLYEWWSVFWDIFVARTNGNHSEVAAAYTETQNIKAKEQQYQRQQARFSQQNQVTPQQQLQLHQQQRRDVNTSLMGTPNAINIENIMGQSVPNDIANKMFEERLKNSHQREGDFPTQMLDPTRVALLKATSSPSVALLQNNGAGTNASFQQNFARPPQLCDMKSDVNISANQKANTDPLLFGAPSSSFVQSKQNLPNPGAI
eukprot:TRINITY_DN4665_c0_g1_i4.p1 TRINITY_DN4665_c0_g1~~TRINITY_DN4665_c0_g1_i4.p1  ORF type:complete len:252 (+),score=63.48 TRINITY_DN4665_c0_g1_i4:333-1088(+)